MEETARQRSNRWGLRLPLVPHFLRELLGPPRAERIPEPELVMEGEEQLRAYLAAGQTGSMVSINLFHVAQATATIQGCRKVVDLGCGPAAVLAQMARLSPEIHFVGVDLSEGMLREAKALVSSSGLTNIELLRADVTRLTPIPDHSADGVISTMALHHLADLQSLKACFSEISRISMPNAATYLGDFGHLKSERTIEATVRTYAKEDPKAFQTDFRNSMRAAFFKQDLAALAAVHCPQAKVHTSLTPFITIVKTAPRRLPENKRSALRVAYEDLPLASRVAFDELRFFMSMGPNAIKDSPFSVARVR